MEVFPSILPLLHDASSLSSQLCQLLTNLCKNFITVCTYVTIWMRQNMIVTELVIHMHGCKNCHITTDDVTHLRQRRQVCGSLGLTYFIRTRMSAVEQILAEVDTNAKVFSSSINLCFQALMIVHQQFNSRNITATSATSLSITVSNQNLISKNPKDSKILLSQRETTILLFYIITIRATNHICHSLRNSDC